jgi:integrase
LISTSFIEFHLHSAYTVTQIVTRTQVMAKKGEIVSDVSIRNIRLPHIGRDEYSVKKSPGLWLYVSSTGKQDWYLRARPQKGIGNAVPIHLGPLDRTGENGLTLQKVIGKAAEWKKEFSLGRDPRDAIGHEKRATFSAARDEFISRAKTAKGRDWSSNTLKSYSYCLRHEKLKKWAHLPISSIKKSAIQVVIESFEEDGKYTAARRYTTYLKAFFTWCQKSKQSYLPPGPLPTDEIELEKPDDNSRDRWLSEQEILLYWEAAERLESPYRQFHQLLLLTGQRRDEIRTMMRKDVSTRIVGHGDHQIEIAAWVLQDNKSNREHLIPLNELALGILRDIPDGNYYFSFTGKSPFTTIHKSKQLITDAMEKVAAEKGLDKPAPWTIHDIRRTFTTHIRRLRVAQDVTDRLLNHALNGVTSKHYDMHEMAEEKVEAMNIWSNYLKNLLHEQPDNVIPMEKRDYHSTYKVS